MINMQAILFYIFVILALGGAFFAIFAEQSRNSVISAFVSFFSVGLLMFSIEQPFIGVIFILINAVSLMILFSLVFLLTEKRIDSFYNVSSYKKTVISLFSVILFVILVSFFIKFGNFNLEGININCVMPSTKDISTEMFINYGIPFLFTGLIFAAAIMGIGVLMSDIRNGRGGQT